MSGLLLFLLLTCLLLHFSSADLLSQSCGGGNYTSNSTYQSNLNHLLTFFTSLNSSFSNHTQGSDPDTAYGLFLCRGDVSPSDCHTCIQNAAEDMLSLCPGSKQATLWYDNCELRFSDLWFFGTVDNSIQIKTNSFKSQGDNFIQLEMELLDKVTEHAAYKSSLMFATGTAVNGCDMVNALAQCTRDLSMDNCSQCLQQIRTEYTGNEIWLEGRALGKSCNFVYGVDSFYQGNPTVRFNLSAPLAPPPSPFAISPPTPSTSIGEGMGFLILSLICIIRGRIECGFLSNRLWAAQRVASAQRETDVGRGYRLSIIKAPLHSQGSGNIDGHTGTVLGYKAKEKRSYHQQYFY